jgi:hypothetical protein
VQDKPEKLRASTPDLQSRSTQRARILGLLIEARGEWVPLGRILDLRIGQFGARIYSLRHELGLSIENKTVTVDGRKQSWFRLAPGVPTPAPIAPACQQSLFDLTPAARYPD